MPALNFFTGASTHICTHVPTDVFTQAYPKGSLNEVHAHLPGTRPVSPVHLSAHMSVNMSAHMSVNMSAHMSVDMSAHMSVNISAHMSVVMSVHMSACRSARRSMPRMSLHMSVHGMQQLLLWDQLGVNKKRRALHISGSSMSHAS